MFTVIFNGIQLDIQEGAGQWFETATGRRRLIAELQEMKHFPRVYEVSLHQDYRGDIYFIIFMRIAGTEHKVRMMYDSTHPDYHIDVTVEYPRLNMNRMVGHWYGENKPCYVLTWRRDWTAMKVATQLRMWFEDYYKTGSPSRDYSQYDYSYRNAEDAIRQAEERFREAERRLGLRRFF